MTFEFIGILHELSCYQKERITTYQKGFYMIYKLFINFNKAVIIYSMSLICKW